MHDNYILHLNRSYEEICSFYDKDLEKNLKRASRFHFIYTSTYNLHKAFSLHQQQYKDRTPHMRDTDYSNFQKLCTRLVQTGEAMIRAILDDENELLSMVALLAKKRQIISY